MTEHPTQRAMMLRYAIRTLRARKGGFIGALLALVCASALITACGVLLETGLRGSIATERYAATPVVVSADQNVHKTTVKHKKGKTKVKHKAKPLAEHVWLPYDTVRTVQRVPGVRRAVPELTFPAYAVTPDDRVLTGPGDTPSYGHAWSSAPLTPFALTRGSAPRSAGDVVVDRELAARAGLEPGDRLTVQSTAAPAPTASPVSPRPPTAICAGRPACSSPTPRPTGSPPAPAGSPPSACWPNRARTRPG